MSLLFINNSSETFTPTQSGALATIIWECCRQANGAEPVVITRTCEAAPFPWSRTIFLEYPHVPSGRLGVLLCRLERKLTGWRHLRQRTYASRVVKAIKDAALTHLPIVVFNEPELVVTLRRRFPKAFLIHWFQNQHECKPGFRARFKRAANVVLGVSDFTASWIEKYYGLREGSVQTLYNGVDIEQFRPAEVESPSCPVINFVGRTGIEKGADLLLEASLRLSEKTKNFSLQLIGSNHWDHFELDAYQLRLNTLSDELQSKGIGVRQPGHVGRAALPGEIRRAHIHVVPARWDEPFGLTTVEGMASGLAVVASRTGGTPEIVRDSGFLFERDSVEGLTKHLDRLISDEVLRAEYARKASKRAGQFTWVRTWAGLSRIVSSRHFNDPQTAT